MARLSRLIAFLLGGVCAAYAAGALFLLATWDGVRVRDELVREVRERSERQLTMEDRPHLRFLPWPVLVAEGVALTEPAGATVVARVGRIEARLALGALIAGRVEVTQIGLIDAEIQLARRPDGKLSFSDLGSAEGRSWPARFSIKALAMERGKIEVLDAAGQAWLRLERVGFESGPIAPGVRGDLHGEATLIHGPGDASGGLEFAFDYLPGRQGYDLESARLRFRGDAWGATGLDTEFDIDSGSGDLGEALVLNGIVLRGHGRFGLRTLSMKLAASRLSGQNGALALEGLKGNLVAAHGDERFEAVFESPAIAPRSADFEGAPLRAAFSSRSSTASSEGRLSSRIAYRRDTRKLELDALALQWKIARRHGKASWGGSANGRAELAPTGQAAALKLQGSYAGTRGKLALDFDEARPVPLQVELDAERFDPGRLAGASGFASLQSFTAALAARSFDARVRAANLVLGGLHASRVSAALSSGGGRLRFSRLELDAYGGSLSGSLESQPQTGRLILDQRFTRISLAPLLADLKLDLPLRGDLSGAWQLAATAGPWSEVSRSLVGGVEATLRNAQWQGVDVAEFLRAARPALKERRAAERTGSARERQAFDSIDFDCRLALGKADCAALGARGDWLQLAGSGSLNLDGSLDWRAGIKVAGRGMPRDFAGLRGRTIPARIAGPLRKPTWKLDWGQPSAQAARPRAPIQTRADRAPPGRAPASGASEPASAG